MKKLTIKLSAALIALASLHAPVPVAAKGPDGQVYFTSEPSLSPDGKTIVFAFEDDLWSVAAEGGKAWRLTGMAGRESNPRFSPDGKWIAFTGRQDGNANVYLVPTDGGSIKQLTWHEGANLVESWSWDSKSIYFSSDAYNMVSAYKVAVEGGTPKRLFPHYFNWPHGLIENPKTGEMYFTDSWESYRFANRKRYKGEFNPDIKSWNPKTKEFKVLTTYNGKDLWPTIDQSGNVYYASDQNNNEYNLYTLKDGKPVSMTSFATSIRQPQVNAKGDKIVFEKDYQVFLFDVASGKCGPVQIQLPANNTLEIAGNFNVKGKITSFDLSADEKKIAFVSRGELFVSDPEGKFVRKLSINSSVGRVMEVNWTSDNLTLVYTKTVDGWPNLFRIKADGSGKEEQLTNDHKSARMLSLNKKRTFGVYLSGRDELRRIDLKSGKSETLLKDEFWGLHNSAPQISPDDQYIAFTARRNFEDDIFLYHFPSKKTINLTNTGVSESAPAWSPDGKAVYFITDRTQPSYPYGFENSKVYRIALENKDSEFKDDRFDKLFKGADKADTLNATPNPIDLENVRWEQVTTAMGSQELAAVNMKKDESKVFYVLNQDDMPSLLFVWSKKPFDKAESKKVEGDEVSNPQVVFGKAKSMVLSNGNLYDLDADAAKLKKISIDYNFSRNLATEFRQMFYETWANLDENFYDEDFHGIDWKKTQQRYETYLPHLKNRSNLRTLLNDMLGELNASHTGFSSYGDEEKSYYTTRTLATGVIFDQDAPFTVKSVVPNSPAARKDKDIRPGDVLYAVDGEKVEEGQNRDFYFSRPSMPEAVTLTFKRGGQFIDVRVHPESPSALKGQLYDEWIAGNQKMVNEKSGKRIAYIHMKNMGGEQLEQFMTEMANEAYSRDGLILDLRYNTGGNVHDKVLQFLSQKPYLNWKYRDGKATSQPNFHPSGKPIVLLINEQSLSDAEMTAAGFKELKLGQIIGTETYRWIIFTSSKSMVDGSTCRMPSWGCFKLNGDDIEKTGVAPDIAVKNTLADRVENKDPQLERAIQEVMKGLK